MHGEALVDRIYECAVLADGWPALLAELGQHVGAQGGFVAAARAQDDVNYVASESVQPLYERFLAEGWAARNPRFPRLAALGEPRFVTDTDICTQEEVDTLPVYTEFLRPLGFEVAAATFVPGSFGDDVILSMEGFASRAAGYDAIPALNGLRPHLARAAMLSARLAFARLSAAADVLEAIGVPAALLGARRVLHANPSFEATGLLHRQGFADWLRDAAAHTATMQGTSRAILPPLLPQPAVLHLYPVRGAARDLFLGVSTVAVLARGQGAVPDSGVIRELLDLTAAEARLAQAVARGQTVAEAARAAGVTEGTARSQLKSIYAKTGIARQTELAVLLNRFAR